MTRECHVRFCERLRGKFLRPTHHLVAMGEGAPRTYRVSNIRRLQPLDTTFRRPKRFDLAQHWHASVAELEARLMQGTARLRLSPEGLRILRAVSPAAAAKAEATRRPSRPAGWLEVEMPVEAVDHAARQLMRLGSEAEVLAPAPLRRAMAREAGRVLALYAHEAAHLTRRRAPP